MRFVIELKPDKIQQLRKLGESAQRTWRQQAAWMLLQALAEAESQQQPTSRQGVASDRQAAAQ